MIQGGRALVKAFKRTYCRLEIGEHVMKGCFSSVAPGQCRTNKIIEQEVAIMGGTGHFFHLWKKRKERGGQASLLHSVCWSYLSLGIGVRVLW